MSMTPEGKVKKYVNALLKRLKAWYFMPVGNGFGKGGVPDIICCIPYTISAKDVGTTVGLFVAIETKAPGKIKNTTQLQEREIENIKTAGGIAFVTDSAEHCLDMLAKRGRS